MIYLKEIMELNHIRGYGNILNSSNINSFDTDEICMIFDNQEYITWEHNKLYGYKIKINNESLNDLTLFVDNITVTNITIKAKNDDEELVKDILIYFYIDGVFVDKKYITSNNGVIFEFDVDDDVELKFIFKGNVEYNNTQLITNPME